MTKVKAISGAPATVGASLKDADRPRNAMKVQLLISETCDHCRRAERIWSEIAAEHRLDFSVVGLERPEGEALAERLQINTIPALVVDGVLVAIGVQTPEEAEEIVASVSPAGNA